jgi:hypothetical protein
MSLSSVHEQCYQRNVQGGVYLLDLHSFAFMYRYILYKPFAHAIARHVHACTANWQVTTPVRSHVQYLACISNA